MLCVYPSGRPGSGRPLPHWAGRRSHQPSSFQRPVTQPDTRCDSRAVERHQAPSEQAQQPRRRLFSPPRCPPRAPTSCLPPSPLAPDRTDNPASPGTLFSTVIASKSGARVRGAHGGEHVNQLGNPDCILITNAKHPRAAICSNGKNQQVPGGWQEVNTLQAQTGGRKNHL